MGQSPPEQSETPALASIGFELVKPSPLLAPFVQSYWSIHNAGPVAETRPEFLHSDGGAGLVFNFGDPLPLWSHAGQRVTTLDHSRTATQTVRLRGMLDLFGVRFHPGGLFALFGAPLDELVEPGVLDDWPIRAGVREVEARIAETPTGRGRAEVVETWLLHRLARAGGIFPSIQASLTLLRHRRGQFSIQALADQVFLSTRQLERLYKEQIGLSPKQFARILRVTHARSLLKQVHRGALVDVAYAAGYYDQAHFIREFKAVVGLTPVAYVLGHRPGAAIPSEDVGGGSSQSSA